MGPILTLLVGFVIVLAITALTGWFVAQEFAFMAVDRSRTAAQAAAGVKRAQQTQHVTQRTSFMLSGAQLGITVTGLVVGYVAEPMIGGSISKIAGDSGLSRGVAATVGAIIALLLSTVIQMVLGELFPKNYAIARPTQVSSWLAPSTLAYLKIFKPLIWLFDKAAEGLLRLLRIEPVHDVEHSATARDLKYIVEESRESGDLTPELSTVIDRILEFPSRTVGHAMIPRARVDTVRDDTPLTQVRAAMEGAHTRYPVMHDDEVVGVIELLDVLALPVDDDSPVRAAMREPFVLSAFTPLPHAVHAMRRKQAQLAVVIDEFGGFAGVLSTEDLAEEVVGEIEDEHDPDDLNAIALDPSAQTPTWVCPGGTPTDEVERALDVSLPQGDYETVGGLAMAYHGGFLGENESVKVPLPLDPGDWINEEEPQQRLLIIDVTGVEHHVPRWVRLTLDVDDPHVHAASGPDDTAYDHDHTGGKA